MTLPPFLRARRSAVFVGMTWEITSYCGFGKLKDPEQAELLNWFCVGFVRFGAVKGSTSDDMMARFNRWFEARDPHKKDAAP